MKIIHLKEKPGCLADIAGWHYREWQALYPHDTLASFTASLQETMADDILPSTWLLTEDGEVLGTASILQDDLDSHPHLSPWLANVFIRADQRGRGLGSRLLQGVLQQAQEQGLPHLYLFTEDQMALYERLGFRQTEQAVCHGNPIAIMKITF